MKLFQKILKPSNALDNVSLMLARSLNFTLKKLVINRGLDPKKSPKDIFAEVLSAALVSSMPSKFLVDYMESKRKDIKYPIVKRVNFLDKAELGGLPSIVIKQVTLKKED